MCALPIICLYSVLTQLPAAEMNQSNGFEGLCIYGLLTDIVQFKFYSYDPTTNKFCFDETIIVDMKRTTAFSDMIDGMYFSQWQFRVDYLLSFQ